MVLDCSVDSLFLETFQIRTLALSFSAAEVVHLGRTAQILLSLTATDLPSIHLLFAAYHLNFIRK